LVRLDTTTSSKTGNPCLLRGVGLKRGIGACRPRTLHPIADAALGIALDLLLQQSSTKRAKSTAHSAATLLLLLDGNGRTTHPARRRHLAQDWLCELLLIELLILVVRIRPRHRSPLPVLSQTLSCGVLSAR
jgi:hypothetical protein